MTCREFESLLVEESGAPEAAAHAAVCPGCAALLERRVRLAAAMRCLAAANAGTAASADVEAGLVRAFREAHAPAVLRRRRGNAWRWAGIAAGVVAAAASSLWLWTPRGEIAPPAMPAPPAAVTLPAQPAIRASAPVGRPAAPRRRLLPRPMAQPSEPAEVRQAAQRESEFVPIPFAARVGPGDSLEIIRVRMPRSAMTRFGMPVSAERAWEPVSADLVLGQDGIPRAIRFAK